MSLPPRIVLITNHSAHGQRLSQGLYERGVPLCKVLIVSGSLKPLSQGIIIWVRSIASLARKRLRFHRQQKPFYKKRRMHAVPAGAMNSESMRRLLKQLKPDYIIAGGGGILHSSIIETARSGVLNVHPALLPWVRGCGVVGHSIEVGIPAGATLHYIDPGIDTGPIIERRLLPVSDGSTTLQDLEWAVDELATRLLVDVVESIVRTGVKLSGTPQDKRYQLFRWPDMDKRREQHERVTARRDLCLFQVWEKYSEGEPNWKLQSDLIDIPSMDIRS